MVNKVTKKDTAFALFDEGKVPLSPELKALGLKGSTRYNYYYEWQKQGGTPLSSSESKGEGKVKGGKIISELAMVVPKEKVNEEDEVEGESEPDENEEELEGSEDKGKSSEAKKPSSDGKKPPTMVAGQGLTFGITISTKTLMLFQYAASLQEDELTLGDFIDTCVEDYYRGRELDLGLVKIGGKND